MNELRWTELAAHVVAWHNRMPLARRIGVQHVQSLGYVMLPFVDTGAGARPPDAPAAEPVASGGGEPLPPEAMTGSLRERAMARAQLGAGHETAAAAPADTPPRLTASVHLRPAFDEDFIPPLQPKAVRRWAQQHAVAQPTPRGEVQVRQVKAEAGLSEASLLPRWVLTAQIDAGGARTRVLVGPGDQPAVLGRRLWSPGRALGSLLLVVSLVGGAVLLPKAAPRTPEAAPAAPASSAASSAVAAPNATSATAHAEAAASASPPEASATHTPPAAHAHETAPPVLAASPSAAPRPAPHPTTEPPPNAEPQLGRVELPSLGPRIDERRRRAQEAGALAAAASAVQASTQTKAQAQTHLSTGPIFAVATRLLRTRSESEQLAAAMRELLARQPGPAVQVEVLPAGDDWRVVGWPYADRALADKAQALLASRGMKVQVVDF